MDHRRNFPGGENSETYKLAAVAAALIIWTGWQNNTVGITHYTVLSDSLPAAFDQYKIAVVSDLHNGEYGENNCRLTSIIKKESPDMIAVTGDFCRFQKNRYENSGGADKKTYRDCTMLLCDRKP